MSYSKAPYATTLRVQGRYSSGGSAYADDSYSSYQVIASGVAAPTAASIEPLTKFGTPFLLRENRAASVGPLTAFGTPTGELVWNPHEVTGRVYPILPLLKFGTATAGLGHISASIGPLVWFGVPSAVLGNKTAFANSTGPLLHFGTPIADTSGQHVSSSIGALLYFGSHTGKLFVRGSVSSIGPLLRFGIHATLPRIQDPATYVYHRTSREYIRSL